MSTIFNKHRHPVRETISQILLVVSLIIAVIYGGKWFPQTELWTALVKAGAVGFLALFVLVAMQTLNHFLLFLALCISVAGDVLLTLPHEASFLRGLLAFAGAHIVYSLLFLKNRLYSEDITSLRIRLATLLLGAAGIAVFFIYPMLGDLLVPVVAYTAVLLFMATTALLSKFPVKLLGLGVFLFVISDALLAAQKFLTLPDYVEYLIWASYYLAQLLITLSILLTDDRPTHYGGYRFD